MNEYKNYKNNMVEQVKSLPSLMRQQYQDLEAKTRNVMTTPEIFSIQEIVLTGCGDSYGAALGTKYAFEGLTGLPVRVVPAVELSRYYPEKQIGYAPYNPLVIAVSNSGSPARVGEAAKRVVKRGGFVLGITGNPDSLLGSSSSRVLKLDIPAFPSSPGVRSYMVSVLALLLLAIRFGEVRGRYTMDEAMRYRTDICSHSHEIEGAMEGLDKQMLDLALRWSHMEAFDFIGSGPDYAAAFYGHAKVYEAIGKYAMCVNTEEWLHLNFFMKQIDKIGTILISSSGDQAKSRLREVLECAVKKMKRPTVFITDSEAEAEASGTESVVLPAPKYTYTAALTQFIPSALLMGYLAQILGEEYGRGCKGSWSFAQNGNGLSQSEIIVK